MPSPTRVQRIADRIREEGEERSQEILEGVSSASGFIRKELASRVQLRSFPRLRFHWDPTPESADRIERMLVQLHRDSPEDS